MNYNGCSFVFNGTGAALLSGGFTCKDLTRTGGANKTEAIWFYANPTCTGTCTLGGNTTQGVNRLLVQSSVVGTQRTITAAAYVITGDVDFMDINLAYSGGASWTNAGSAFIGDCLGNAGAVTTKSLWPHEHKGNPNPTIVSTEHWMLNAVGVPDAGPAKAREEIGDYMKWNPAEGPELSRRDEVQLLRRVPVVRRQHPVDFVNYGLGQAWPKLLASKKDSPLTPQ